MRSNQSLMSFIALNIRKLIHSVITVKDTAKCKYTLFKCHCNIRVCLIFLMSLCYKYLSMIYRYIKFYLAVKKKVTDKNGKSFNK